MKINFEQKILSYTGEPFLTNQKLRQCPHCNESLGIDEVSGIPLTLKLACARSLATLLESEGAMNGDERGKLGLLAIRVFEADGEMNISAEEIVLLKERVGRLYPPVVVARVFEALDPSE